MTSEYPLISVIIPVYNGEECVRSCVDSVLRQTYKNLEIILVDDGSKDNSPKICDEYVAKDQRVKVIHKKNGGITSARNEGLKIAKGSYIGFIDHDDTVSSDMYEYLYQLISKENSDLAQCGHYTQTKTGTWKAVKDLTDSYVSGPLTHVFDFSSWIYVWNKLFKKELLKDQLFNPKQFYGEDASFVFEFVKKGGQVCVGNRPMYYWNFCPASASHIFKPSYLPFLTIRSQEMKYAKENNWANFVTTKRNAEVNAAIVWLGMLSEKESSEGKSVDYLRGYLREHLFDYVKDKKYPLKSKLFAIVCCISFTVAKVFYKVLHRGPQIS